MTQETKFGKSTESGSSGGEGTEEGTGMSVLDCWEEDRPTDRAGGMQAVDGRY